MKTIYTLLVLSLLSFKLLAQPGTTNKTDLIQKTNGEEMKGKVVKINDTDVTFIYAGETAEYVLKKSEIAKITHSSGRVETFNQNSAPAQVRQQEPVTMASSSTDHHNKIAILPFTYLMDNQPGADAIGYKAQEDTYSILSKNAAGYTILDPRTTNALLSKNGVTKDQIINFTMKEIADILSVEYIIDGIVTQNKGYLTSTSSESSNSKVKRDDNKNLKGLSNSGFSTTSEAQRYDVAVTLHIYMDNNASIYNQTHKAFLSNTDGSYKSPLEYLLKRCPLYRK